ncbi:MAG: hypothetical protein AAFQ63_14580 [Cyanobacteria bacterium J06621_11]
MQPGAGKEDLEKDTLESDSIKNGDAGSVNKRGRSRWAIVGLLMGCLATTYFLLIGWS